MISGTRISHAYGDLEVLLDASVSAGPGEVVGLIGPNGSGKTTLLRSLYRALTPSSGQITIDGSALAALPPREIARRVAVVVQEPASDLPLTVLETVLLGRNPHLSTWQRHSAGDLEIAARALRRVGSEHLAERDVSELSGGERQRALIARALAQQTTHLLLDEPTNHLDIHFQHEVLTLVRDLDVATIIVLHDLNLAARYCDRLVLLDQGRVAAAGTVEEVLSPEVIDPVYGIRTQPVRADDGSLQLLFRMADQHPPTHSHGSPARNGAELPL